MCGGSSGPRVAPAGGPATTAMVLFSPETPPGTVLSPRLTVIPGVAYLISAYNLPSDRKIYLNQVSTGTIASGICSGRNRDQDFFIQRFVLGGEERWTMDAERPQLLLAAPGRYRLELENEDMLGAELQVEYTSWPLKDTSTADIFPFFGVNSQGGGS